MSDFDHAVQEARRLAQTPQGKQLIQSLQQLGSPGLQQAAQAAAAGNLDQAKALVSQLMSTPEARKLLQALGENHGK